MSKKELLTLKKEVSMLYKIFMEAYTMEGSRGYRQDLRNYVEASYKRFILANDKLPEEERVKSAVSLTLTA